MVTITSSNYLPIYLKKAANSPAGGGLNTQSAAIWDLLLKHQQTNLGISGNIGEIGVWYGFASGLSAVHLQADEELFLIDKYLRKQEVADNIAKTSGKKIEAINWIQADSISVRKKEKLKDYFDSFRWFHVDGEHSYDGVMSDLELALQCVHQGGIIVVDDFFNISSASITEAVFHFLDRYKHLVCMFCCGYNKAYLSSPKFLKHYRDAVYYNIIDILENLNVKVMLAQNGWSTEFDYISVVSRAQNYKLQKIGQYCKDLEAFG